VNLTQITESRFKPTDKVIMMYERDWNLLCI
jgi:hypothetical protein